jgi:hypothetical protein
MTDIVNGPLTPGSSGQETCVQHAPHGTADALREFITENLHMVRIQADLSATYSAIGDDVGLQYAVRRLTTYSRAVIETLVDLKNLNLKVREADDAAR